MSLTHCAIIISALICCTKSNYPNYRTNVSVQNLGHKLSHFINDTKLRLSRQSGIHFYAFVGPEHPDQRFEIKIGDVQSLQNARLVPGEIIHIHAHGFREPKGISLRSLALKDAYMKAGFKNVIFITWENTFPILGNIPIVQFLTYPSAIRKYISRACDRFTKFLMFLFENRIQPDQIHLTGESLGAHLIGCVGTRLRTKYGILVPRITGFDPAGPFSKTMPAERKINKGSGAFVQVIHTSIDGYGLPDAVGHVDFYANGGRKKSQNSCIKNMHTRNPVAIVGLIICAHVRAQTLWTYTVSQNVNLDGYPCDNHGENSSPRNRSKTVCGRPLSPIPAEAVRFGEYSPETSRGTYYLPTTDSTIRDMEAANITVFNFSNVFEIP